MRNWGNLSKTVLEETAVGFRLVFKIFGRIFKNMVLSWIRNFQKQGQVHDGVSIISV